jgi:hypothetical protein
MDSMKWTSLLSTLKHFQRASRQMVSKAALKSTNFVYGILDSVENHPTEDLTQDGEKSNGL